ncbi:hypothetical protein GWK47_047915 [Chionoecetes opilio]|uniref:Transmembrane protein 237 n=1 Tax=Chionoecetes opilio TaxID=41210 RepID=A0A8J4YBI0_CHIOP|nr:hypothetical protein GWK47_047915 [Chionoecetes opilio]
MREAPRTASARSSDGGSRRRRWEMRSKESFEKSLAIEVNSPQRRNPRYRRESRREPAQDNPDDKNPFFQESPKSSPPKDSNQKHEADHQASESDLLSSKLAALIEEANVKAKDSEKTSVGEKRRSSWGHLDQRTERNSQEPHYNQQGGESLKVVSEAMSLKDWDRAQVINDKFETKSLKVAGESPKMKLEERKEEKEEEKAERADYTPSAPPMLSAETSKTPSTKKKKKLRGSNSRMLVEGSTSKESYITLQLREMEEDVIGAGREDHCVLSAPALLFNTTINPTGTISTIYQEKLGGFVIARNDMEGVQRKNEDLRDGCEVPTPSSHAIFLQSGFRTFAVLCQGLLAGITLAHCLMIFLLESKPSSLPAMYPPIVAHVFLGLILLLTTLCLVAAFDRCDLGVDVFSGHGIKIPWTPALYISSLVLSLLAVRAENVLINFKTFVPEVVSEEKASDLVDWWRWVCVGRTSLAVLAWLAVTSDPHTDALLDALQHNHHK